MRGAETVRIQDVAGGAVIAVKAVAGSSRNGIAGVLGGCLKITTSAPPEKGRANAAVARILAQALEVKASQVLLVSGASRPRKQFRIAELSARQVRQRLQEAQ
jgi:uncharacterized protein (TIGR00251 family)